MTNLSKNRPFAVHTETVITGDRSSRLSSVIFLLLCIVPVFSAVLYGAVDATTWIFILLAWAAIILLWLAESWKAGGLLFNTNSLQIPLLGLLAIGLVQMLPLGASSNALTLDPYSTRLFVIRLIVFCVFFSACLAFINNESRLKKVVAVIIISGSLMAFFGILQRLASPEGIYGIRGTPQAIPFGPFVNQHHFAAFMEMTGGVALGLLFGRSTHRDKKILITIAVVIVTAALIMTSSRGGVLGFLAVFAFVLLLNFLPGPLSVKANGATRHPSGNPQKFALIAGAVAILVVTLGLVFFLGGNDSLLRGIGVANADTDVTSGRLHFWPVAIRIFLEHPVLGAGFDAFAVAFTKHDTWNGTLRVERAHNEYLQTLADAGIAGSICLAGFIALLFRKGLRTIADSAVSFRRDAAIGALSGCFGILIHSFFDFPLRTYSNAFFFLLLCAIAVVPIAIKKAEGATVREGFLAGGV